MQDERAELIGELKAGFNFLKTNHENVLKAIEKIADGVEDGRRRIYERIEDHEHDNLKSFHEIGDALQRLIIVTAKIDQHEDRIDSNDRAILDHETRLAAQEVNSRIAIERSKINSHWLKGIALALAGMAGDHFSGNKITDLITHIFGK